MRFPPAQLCGEENRHNYDKKRRHIITPVFIRTWHTQHSELKLLTVRADQHDSNSQTACPGKSVAPGWRWAVPLWKGPCPAAAASAGPRSDPCSPLIRFLPGTPPQPEGKHTDMSDVCRGCWLSSQRPGLRWLREGKREFLKGKDKIILGQNK